MYYNVVHKYDTNAVQILPYWAVTRAYAMDFNVRILLYCIVNSWFENNIVTVVIFLFRI